MHSRELKCVALALTLVMLTLVFSTTTHAYEQALNEISLILAAAMEAHGTQRLAVADFVELGGATNQFGRLVAERITSNLVRAKRSFSVVDRQHLMDLLQEIEKGASGLMDMKTVQRLGKMANADTMIAGTMSLSGEYVLIMAKVLSVETAEVIWIEEIQIPRTRAVDELWAKVIVQAPKAQAPVQSTTTAPSLRSPEPALASASAPGSNTFFSVDISQMQYWQVPDSWEMSDDWAIRQGKLLTGNVIMPTNMFVVDATMTFSGVPFPDNWRLQIFMGAANVIPSREMRITIGDVTFYLFCNAYCIGGNYETSFSPAGSKRESITSKDKPMKYIGENAICIEKQGPWFSISIGGVRAVARRGDYVPADRITIYAGHDIELQTIIGTRL